MFHLDVNFPLSVYLQGTKALKKHPKVRRYLIEKGARYEFYKVECAFEKEEKVGELQCVKIRCKRWYYTKSPPAIQYLWLAPERNYLCVKAQTMSRIAGVDLPSNESQVGELREIAPKLCLPMRVSTKYYSYDALREKKLVVGLSRTQTVVKVVTTPQHLLSLFRDVKIPDGVSVFTIGADGRLTDSPSHPSESLEPGRTTLAEIIQHIGANEKLYENIEVSVKAAYRMPWARNASVSEGNNDIPTYDVTDLPVISIENIAQPVFSTGFAFCGEFLFGVYPGA
jgi:hypothetical protein